MDRSELSAASNICDQEPGTDANGTDAQSVDIGQAFSDQARNLTGPLSCLDLDDKSSSAQPRRNTGLSEPNSLLQEANVVVPDQTLHGVSQWSHQVAVEQHNSNVEKRSAEGNKKDEWQEMVVVVKSDIYDEKGNLVKTAQDIEPDDDNIGGSSKGYTRMRIDEEDDSDCLEESTSYLFNETADDEAAKSPISQMQVTKEFLSEGQRVAYVGLCRLIMHSMVHDIARQRNKSLSTASESMTLWSQKMLLRLYTHMDIVQDEQIMIEQLHEHGVIPNDLCPALLGSSKVAKNSITESVDSGSGVEHIDDMVFSDVAKDNLPMPCSVEIKSVEEIANAKELTLDLRWTILCDLFLVLTADSVYDSRSRVLLIRVGDALGLNWLDITKFEKRITDALELQDSGQQQWNQGEILESRKKLARNKRFMVMGLATLGGGLVIGLSAGVLAPVIGAGLGAALSTVGVAGTTGFLGGAGGAALITTGGVLTGSGIAGKASARRTRNVSTFEFRPLHNSRRVNILVTVSGWMNNIDDDVRLPFSTIDPIMGDVFSVLWEPEVLSTMGQTVNILATEIMSQGLQVALGQTVLMSLMVAIQWPIILTKLSYFIDNPWNNSLDRAKAAGLVLADTLISRNLGIRPVSLAGFSLGARVIYYCLLELARCHAYGLIQDVYLFGTPVVYNKLDWARAASVVAGRLVNGFKRDDWVLGYLFRATSGGIRRVVGLRPIEDSGTLENLDCTQFVEGHYSYREAMPKLMSECGWIVSSEEFIEIEDPDPHKERERQRELKADLDEIKKAIAEGRIQSPKSGIFNMLKTRKKEPESDNQKSIIPYDESEMVIFDVDAIKNELTDNDRSKDDLPKSITRSDKTTADLDLDGTSAVAKKDTNEATIERRHSQFETDFEEDDEYHQGDTEITLSFA